MRSSRLLVRARPAPTIAALAFGAHARPLARCGSSFAYLRAGRVAALRHEAVWDESQRDEAWDSSALPRVSLDPAVAAAADESRAAARHARAARLRAEHPDVWLVHLLVDRKSVV